jgi:AAA family ATP:ADP antiporter
MQKLVPLASMFFCILFSYTILRDTKDVLVITAPGGSAEVIPFLKTWVNLPGAILFTVLYSALSNRMGGQALFYTMLTPFLAFFGSFAAFIYPMRDVLHPNQFCDFLLTVAPAGFAAPIGCLRNWTYSLFYLLANMWGSVVVSLMFWGFANEITTVKEAKKYYPLFGMFANVALVFSGQFVRRGCPWVWTRGALRSTT